MEVTLLRANIDNAKELHAMQVEAFKELLEKYQDFDTSPGNESVEKVEARLKQDFTFYYFICIGQQKVGAIRIVDKKESGKNKKISPIFILPDFQGKGIAQKAIRLCEEIHGNGNWELDTILQEPKNCHLYEKMGYRQTGKTKVINERLTLVFYEKRRLYMENLIVRYAKREELESANNIRKQVNEVHVKGRPDIFREDGWQFIESFIYTRFDEENSGVIVATNEDEIVGFAVVQYIVRPESPYNKERRYLHIEEFGVDEKHRRKGIATAIIDFIKEDAKNRGFKRIELDMWEFNDGALAFYESAGLKTYRRYMESYTDTEEGNRK